MTIDHKILLTETSDLGDTLCVYRSAAGCYRVELYNDCGRLVTPFHTESYSGRVDPRPWTRSYPTDAVAEARDCMARRIRLERKNPTAVARLRRLGQF